MRQLEPLFLRRVEPPTSRLWNEYIERYYYLGHKTLPGAQLRYFVVHAYFEGTLANHLGEKMIRVLIEMRTFLGSTFSNFAYQ